MSELGAIEKLRADHDLTSFDCGKDDLNRFLQRYALPNQQANSALTYVACRGKAVIGYYSLTVGAVAHAEATERVKKAMPRYPIPVMILARLAVGSSERGRGLGKALLNDAPASAPFWSTQRITTRRPSTNTLISSRVRPTPIICSC